MDPTVNVGNLPNWHPATTTKKQAIVILSSSFAFKTTHQHMTFLSISTKGHDFDFSVIIAIKCPVCKHQCVCSAKKRVLKLNFPAKTENQIFYIFFAVLLCRHPLRLSTHNFFYVSTDNLSPTSPRASQ